MLRSRESHPNRAADSFAALHNLSSCHTRTRTRETLRVSDKQRHVTRVGDIFERHAVYGATLRPYLGPKVRAQVRAGDQGEQFPLPHLAYRLHTLQWVFVSRRSPSRRKEREGALPTYLVLMTVHCIGLACTLKRPVTPLVAWCSRYMA